MLRIFHYNQQEVIILINCDVTSHYKLVISHFPLKGDHHLIKGHGHDQINLRISWY